MKKEEGINLHEGTPCAKCGAPLKVVKVISTGSDTDKHGSPLNQTDYVCEGAEPHYWGTAVDLQVGPERVGYTLIALKSPSA